MFYLDNEAARAVGNVCRDIRKIGDIANP